MALSREVEPNRITPSSTRNPGPPAASHKIYDTLDAIRGIGAVAIVTYHASGLIGPGLLFESADLAVDLFFILSGFVIALAYDERLRHGLTVPAFLELRLVRLYPLYLLGLALGLGTALASLAAGETLWTPGLLAGAALRALFYVPDPLPPVSVPIFPLNGPAWSLYFEVVINFVYVILLPRLSTRLLLAILGLAVVALVVTALHFRSLNVGADSVTFVGGMSRVTFGFFAGVLIFRERHRFSAIRVSAWLPLGLTLVILAIRVGYDGPVRIAYDLAAVCVLMPVTVILGIFSQPSPRFHAGFNFLGVTSYAVYCLHSPLLQAYYLTIRQLGVNPVDLQPWAGIAFTVVVIAVAKVVDEFYDAPARRWLADILHLHMARKAEARSGQTDRRR